MVFVNRTRPRIGDVVEIATSRGLAYAHYTHEHDVPPRYGALLRVLPGLFEQRPLDFSGLVLLAPRFITFFPLGAACNRGSVRIVANEPVPQRSQAFPTFRNSHRDRAEKRVPPWFLWDGAREWRVDKLSEQQLRDYPPLGVWNDTLLTERIAAGWAHEIDS
ncbi:MAG: hypothetical protein U0572_11295 [Phycisphaerales bacterium]